MLLLPADPFSLRLHFLSAQRTTYNRQHPSGVFFKCKDPKATTEWYQKHLGLDTNPYGATFEWYESPDSTKKAQTQWTPFKQDSKYFDKDFMINYRVENLEGLVEELKIEGVNIVDKIETYDYGKFIHILDGEGNKIQLWEAKE